MDSSIIAALRHFVTVTLLHPILVNFTAALIPVSIGSDILAGYFKNESFRDTAWWTLLYATLITPLTAIAGWLFWMQDDDGVLRMTIHKYLGTTLAVLLIGLFLWRLKFHRERRWVSVGYLIVGAILTLALVVQGHLGGEQVFSGM